MTALYNDNLVDLLQAVPLPLALCDADSQIAFRTAGWLARFQSGSERVVLPSDAAAARLLARSPQGQPVDMPLQALKVERGFWLQPDVEATAAPVVAELRQRLADLEQHALKDALTGLWNRRFYDATVGNEVARADRHGHPMSLLVIDVDHFKGVNDQHGHAVGDQVLQAVARILSDRCRSSDLVMRWGGDEFAVLATFCSWRNAAALAEDLRRRVAAADLGPGVAVTLSIGVAQYLPGQSAKAWFDRADAQLYQVKRNGRNAVGADHQAPVEPDQAVVRLVWRDSYVCGHPTIDDQHQILVSLANRVLQAALPGPHQTVDTQRLLLDLDELLRHVQRHFADEEAILYAAGYPRARQHALAHTHLVEQATLLRSQIREGNPDLGRLLDFLARDVVVRHMAAADADFYPWLGEQAPSLAPPKAQ